MILTGRAIDVARDGFDFIDGMRLFFDRFRNEMVHSSRDRSRTMRVIR